MDISWVVAGYGRSHTKHFHFSPTPLRDQWHPKGLVLLLCFNRDLKAGPGAVPKS